jgi:hypothetical protein
MGEDWVVSNFIIHEFLALEGKMKQFAKALASTRRTCKAPTDPMEKKNEMKERHVPSL